MFPLIMWLMIKRHCWWSLRSAHTVRVTLCSVLLVFYLKFKPAVKLPVSLALTCTCVVVEGFLFPGRLLVLEISRTKLGRVTGTVTTPVHREQQRFLLTRFFGFCMQQPEFVSRMGGDWYYHNEWKIHSHSHWVRLPLVTRQHFLCTNTRQAYQSEECNVCTTKSLKVTNPG